jgi:hypothetical protein
MLVKNLALALLILSGAFDGGGQRPPAWVKTEKPETVEPIVIPFELLANRPLVRVKVNGQGPFAFLISPEHQRSLVDLELAETLKLRQPNAGAPDLVVDLGLGDRDVKLPVVIQDIDRLVPELGHIMRPRGVLALSSWKDQLVTLDYSKWRVTFEPGALPDPNGKEIFALNSSGEFRLLLSIADQSVECHVDPLFPSGLLLPPSSSTSLQFTGDPRDGGTVRVKERDVRVREARLAGSVKLGPFELKAPHVLLAVAGDTAIVGTPWLWRYVVTYDVTNARVRLDPAASQLTRQ